VFKVMLSHELLL